jgi:cation diffusion facilitator CzcD-associated flavoprotein CzcO
MSSATSTAVAGNRPNDTMKAHYDVVILGAGVSGIYQLYKLKDSHLDTALIDVADGPGGTWYWNRYPGCRFDSESFTYGYSFSRELLDEWHWKERFSSQPENLRYLEYVTDKFDLRKYMFFGRLVESAHYDESEKVWRLSLGTGEKVSCRWLISCLGVLSAPTLPRIEGMQDFEGQSFHTYYWPKEPVELEGKRVAVVGTGATGVQIIGKIAPIVGELLVFQRRPNWCAPLNNSEITEEEMQSIREKYEEIFEACSRTPGGFLHQPDRRPFYSVSREERVEMWERLYQEPGFGIWLQNFREIFMDDAANAEFSEFIAEKIRSRVNDPELAERLIPKDHGFGVQRVPLETKYYEAYNEPHVKLISLEDTPIERITSKGIVTSQGEFECDVIIYATGFDAMTGAYERIDFKGRDGLTLIDHWRDGPNTYLGTFVEKFPNLLLIAGPQSGSASINFPRSIELCVDWATRFLDHVIQNGYTEFEVTADAVDAWARHVEEMYSLVLMRKAKSWFTGYNSNVENRDMSKPRYLVYNGGQPKYRQKLVDCEASGYEGLVLS